MPVNVETQEHSAVIADLMKWWIMLMKHTQTVSKEWM